MTQQSSGFWSSLQGILVGLAAVITAVATLYTAMNSNGANQANNNNNSQTTQESVAQKTTGKPEKQTEQRPAEPSVTLSSQQLVSAATIVKPSLEKRSTTLSDIKKQTHITLPELVDCSLFPTVNTVRSLMSWSNHYHQKILDAKGVTARAARPCKKTIAYRAQAHCKVPDDVVVRQALFETLKQCEVASIHWKDTIN